MGRMTRRILLLTIVASAAARPAFADFTAFIGLNPTPVNRSVRGLAVGAMFLILGFEFEYANTSEDLDEAAPSLHTGMGNLVVQTPFPVAGMLFYATTGAGFYRERLAVVQETHVGVNVGGGIKIGLAGPLRLRVDYRLFTLRGRPLHATPQRLYAGLNLGF
jgi:hypothetical protein